MNALVDARDVPLVENMFVCYTTNDRGSGLQFGHIDKIKATHGTRWEWDRVTSHRNQVPHTTYTIVIAKTDSNGTPIYDTVWDSEAPNPDSLAWGGSGKGKHIPTDKQSKSGHVQFHSNKFLAL